MPILYVFDVQNLLLQQLSCRLNMSSLLQDFGMHTITGYRCCQCGTQMVVIYINFSRFLQIRIFLDI